MVLYANSAKNMLQKLDLVTADECYALLLGVAATHSSIGIATNFQYSFNYFVEKTDTYIRIYFRNQMAREEAERVAEELPVHTSIIANAENMIIAGKSGNGVYTIEDTLRLADIVSAKPVPTAMFSLEAGLLSLAHMWTTNTTWDLSTCFLYFPNRVVRASSNALSAVLAAMFGENFQALLRLKAANDDMEIRKMAVFLMKYYIGKEARIKTYELNTLVKLLKEVIGAN